MSTEGKVRVKVAYEHQSDDLTFIYLAGTSGTPPAEDDWVPALRDTIGGRRVVTATLPTSRKVWLRDRNGERSVRTI